MKEEVEFHQRNLSLLLKSGGAKANAAAAVLDTYKVCLLFSRLFVYLLIICLYIKDKIWELNQIPDEVAWDMLAASEYVNSIMTTLVRIHKRDYP